MFKKLLASIGVGSAKVDTRLDNDVVVPGEMLSGEVYVLGGDVAQEIAEIYLYVATTYKREHEGDEGDTTYEEECRLLRHHVCEAFTLQPKEEKVIPFSLTIPYETPLTLFNHPVYLRTGLDIAMAINPRDTDNFQVQPHPLMEKVLEAVENLGFDLYKVDCEYNPSIGRTYPFVQEFEFRPTGEYRGRLDELELIFFLEPNKLDVFMQIDKRARGLGGFLQEAFDLDERYAQFQVTSFDLETPWENLAGMIDEIIQSRLQ